MTIAARFKIAKITKHDYQQADGVGGEVQLRAVVDKGNESWSRYTPSGEITMVVTSPAFPWFEERLGEVLALTFDDVPPAPETTQPEPIDNPTET